MQGIYLKLFVAEGLRHHGDLLYEWILQQAHAIGIPGGSAVRAVAGFGRHGRLHEQHFATEDAIAKLLTLLESENISVFYVKFVAEGGLTQPSANS